MNYTEFMARVEDKLQESSGFPVAGMSVQEMERLCLEIGHRSFGAACTVAEKGICHGGVTRGRIKAFIPVKVRLNGN